VVAVLSPFVMSRAIVLLVTIITAMVRHRPALTLWNAWDGAWYLGIAAHGYHWGIHGKPAAAFFPLFPLAVRTLTQMDVPPLLGGILISNIAFLGALFYVYALVRPEWGKRAAGSAVVLLCLFPTGFVTFAPYSESMFLLCSAAALFHARRGETLTTGLWVALAVLTRSSGLILLPAVVVSAGGLRRDRWPSLVAPSVAALAGYGLYLQQSNIPLTAALQSQRYWHRSLTVPWTGFTASLRWLSLHATQHPSWAIENILGVAVTLLFLWLTWVARRDLAPGMAVYCCMFWALVLCTPEWRDGYYAPFSSMDRFVLELFPLAPWIAIHLSESRLQRLQFVLGGLLAGATAWHLAGGWVG
jgi:Gpi18-like mannosyltransferase